MYIGSFGEHVDEASVVDCMPDADAVYMQYLVNAKMHAYLKESRNNIECPAIR